MLYGMVNVDKYCDIGGSGFPRGLDAEFCLCFVVGFKPPSPCVALFASRTSEPDKAEPDDVGPRTTEPDEAEPDDVGPHTSEPDDAVESLRRASFAESTDNSCISGNGEKKDRRFPNTAGEDGLLAPDVGATNEGGREDVVARRPSISIAFR